MCRYKGGKELKSDTDKRITIEKVDETIYRLTISGTSVDDTGNYKVVASNAAGTVGSEAKVAVERKGCAAISRFGCCMHMCCSCG